MDKKESQEITNSAWEKLRPLLTHEIKTSEDDWVQRYCPDASEVETYFWGSRDRFAMLLQLLSNRLHSGASILDAGAGYGVQPAVLKTAGFEAFASDIYDGVQLYEPLGIKYKPWHLEAEAAPYPDNTFDAVVLSQTIEHFTYSPRKPLEEMLRITKPGGYILIDAPNIAAFRNISRLLRGKSIHWDMKKHYLEQEPSITNGTPYYDRHNHEYAMQDFHDIASYFNLEMVDNGYFSPLNWKMKSRFVNMTSYLRDIVPHWRKSLYAMFRLPT